MIPLNPYIAGNPIAGEEGFFGREDILHQIERLFTSPSQNAAVIFGQRRIGKTTVLLQLERRLDQDRFVTIYQDLMDKATVPLGEVLNELAYTIALEVGIPEPELDFDDQGLTFQRNFLPQVYESLPTPEHALVLLFDEFDVLDVLKREKLDENVAANQLFRTLRRWILEEPRLKFGFALGRELSDLDTDFYSAFKGAQTIRISVLERAAAIQLITSPTQINYTPQAVKHIYHLTSGHPYFTQLLCQQLFECAYSTSSEKVPVIQEGDVETALPLVFQVGDNVFAWVWDGLPPAERVIAATLAELLPDDTTTASRDAILEVLQARRVRILTRELETSPEKLVDWQLLQREASGYRFLVPILHRWIRARKPLDQVQDELDRINPRAQRYFEVGRLELDEGNLELAITNFEQALRVNPEHLQARLSVAETYLEVGQLDRAVENYEQAYQRDEIRARSGLVKALFARITENGFKPQSLKDCTRILEIQPGNLEAQQRLTQAREELAAHVKKQTRKLQEAVVAKNWEEVKELRDTLQVYAPGLEISERETYARQLVSESASAWERDEWRSAITYLRGAVDFTPEDEGIATRLEWLLEERNELIRTRRRVIQIIPLVFAGIGAVLAPVWNYFSSFFASASPDAVDVGTQLLVCGFGGAAFMVAPSAWLIWYTANRSNRLQQRLVRNIIIGSFALSAVITAIFYAMAALNVSEWITLIYAIVIAVLGFLGARELEDLRTESLEL